MLCGVNAQHPTCAPTPLPHPHSTLPPSLPFPSPTPTPPGAQTHASVFPKRTDRGTPKKGSLDTHTHTPAALSCHTPPQSNTPSPPSPANTIDSLPSPFLPLPEAATKKLCFLQQKGQSSSRYIIGSGETLPNTTTFPLPFFSFHPPLSPSVLVFVGPPHHFPTPPPPSPLFALSLPLVQLVSCVPFMHPVRLRWATLPPSRLSPPPLPPHTYASTRASIHEPHLLKTRLFLCNPCPNTSAKPPHTNAPLQQAIEKTSPSSHTLPSLLCPKTRTWGPLPPPHRR